MMDEKPATITEEPTAKNVDAAPEKVGEENAEGEEAPVEIYSWTEYYKPEKM